jgi:hypothetical protein
MIPEIKESLAKNDVISLVIPDVNYNEILIDVAGMVSREYEKILYLSVSKSYDELMREFTKNKIGADRFLFIDCITGTSKDVQSAKNCVYVSSPKAMDEMHRAILDILKEHKINLMLIDSPSALLTYRERMDVLKFIHLLVTKLTFLECKSIIPFRKESSGPMRRSIEMFVDETVHVAGESSQGSGLRLNPDAKLNEMILIIRKISFNIQFMLT